MHPESEKLKTENRKIEKLRREKLVSFSATSLRIPAEPKNEGKLFFFWIRDEFDFFYNRRVRRSNTKKRCSRHNNSIFEKKSIKTSKIERFSLFTKKFYTQRAFGTASHRENWTKIEKKIEFSTFLFLYLTRIDETVNLVWTENWIEKCRFTVNVDWKRRCLFVSTLIQQSNKDFFEHRQNSLDERTRTAAITKSFIFLNRKTRFDFRFFISKNSILSQMLENRLILLWNRFSTRNQWRN